MRIDSSPVYVDTSALAKLFLPEPESDAVDDLLSGRSDLLVATLAATELASVLARHVREGRLDARQARRAYRLLLRDFDEGRFLVLEAVAEVHREAERVLLALGTRMPLRAADALHLAHASKAGARVFLTFDRRLSEAAEEIGTFEVVGA